MWPEESDWAILCLFKRRPLGACAWCAPEAHGHNLDYNVTFDSIFCLSNVGSTLGMSAQHLAKASVKQIAPKALWWHPHIVAV